MARSLKPRSPLSMLLLAVVGALAWGLVCMLPLHAQHSAVQKHGEVMVDIVGLHSDKGRVLAALFCGKAGFPSDVAKACARKLSDAKGRHVRLVFTGVPAGEFAVAVIHDENDNGTLDRNFIGIPTEGWGTSRDAKAHFGPPSYTDARMRLSAGEHKHIVVHMQY